jgi:hypothetical protein
MVETRRLGADRTPVNFLGARPAQRQVAGGGAAAEAG